MLVSHNKLQAGQHVTDAAVENTKTGRARKHVKNVILATISPLKNRRIAIRAHLGSIQQIKARSFVQIVQLANTQK